MTPLWKKYAQYLARKYTTRSMPDLERRFLNVERCFDLTAVSTLCDEVWRELFRSGGTGSSGSDIFDLGEKAAMPCEHFWLEFEQRAFLVETCNYAGSGQFVVSELWIDEERPLRLVPLGYIEQAEDLFEVGASVECPDDLTVEGWQACGWVLSAIAVLNSPRARREDTPAKKLLGHKYPRLANPSIRSTRIVIDLGCDERGVPRPVAWTSSPKAYHFVRSHVRRFEDGTHTIVRAHWRGDPAFGIRIGHYVVKDRAA